ncbi:hypothetical protein VB735_33300 [Halotia wernerae UHCC 0503]|nr:hypothetical protein [Halotia wernerae UHCC 0503]
MAKIVISGLSFINVETFLHELAPVKAEMIMGGRYFESWAGDIQILTVHDGINQFERRVESASGYVVRNNKFDTIDYSRTNNIYV